MTKNDYRTFFAQCKPFIRFRFFLDLAKISPVNFSRFMRGDEWDYEVSLDKLNVLYHCILDTFQKIA